MWRAFTIVVVACGVVVLAALSSHAQETDVETPLTVHGSHVDQGHRLGLEITERTRSLPRADHS